MTGRSLEHAGFEVHGFADPLTALQHIQKDCRYCQVLVSDIRMPALTGFQLVRRVKDLRPGMIVIVMTMFEVNKCEFGAVFPSTPIDGVIRKTIYIFTAGRKNKRIFGHDDSRDYKTNRWQQGLISIKSGKNITEY